jgi:hypothetical protein
VAVYAQAPVAAWRIRDAFPTDESYTTPGGPRPRVGLSLGDPLPLLSAYGAVPALRHGSATVTLDVPLLGPERDESLING